MKNILLLFFLLALLIMLQSCATQPILYHSEANLPYSHSSTKTVFKLIKDDYATNSFQFGVISAKDNDTLSYILLAPSKQAIAVNNLADVKLSYAIPLLTAQVKEFIKILNSSAEKWSNKFDSKDGISYEFIVSPENRIIPQSENVVVGILHLNFIFRIMKMVHLALLFLEKDSYNIFIVLRSYRQ